MRKDTPRRSTSQPESKAAMKSVAQTSGTHASTFPAQHIFTGRYLPAPSPIRYARTKGIEAFVAAIREASPFDLVETERQGVAGAFVVDLAKRMKIPEPEMFSLLGVSKAVASKSVAPRGMLTGCGGLAALGMVKLLSITEEMVRNSTAPEAEDFDWIRWLGSWLQQPIRALGGVRPADLVDTAAGVDIVAKCLGAIESGSYQ